MIVNVALLFLTSLHLETTFFYLQEDIIICTPWFTD